MPVTATSILGLLDQLPEKPGKIWIAYSGGVDSHVLLHCCHRLRDELPEIAGAIHVHHGISEQADAWERHCVDTCEALGLSCEVARVTLGGGEGLEDRARRVRYDAIQSYLQQGDVVLMAQHQDDQAETFLLQALRGGGPRGVAAMPAIAPLGQGYLLRPMLSETRASVLEYARSNRLHWVEDDSNQDMRFERNFIRHEVMPQLLSRWPAASRTLARTSAHTASLVTIADELISDELQGVTGSRPETLSVRVLKSLPVEKASLLVRALCQQLELPMPATSHIAELLQKQLHAEPDRQIHVTWPGGEFRRYQDDLYIQSPLPRIEHADWQYQWDGDGELHIPEYQGRLSLEACIGDGIQQNLVEDGLLVRPRSGGERCQPAGDSYRRELKVIFQQRGIPPWERERMPLIYQGDELLAIADLIVCESALAREHEPGYLVQWKSIH